MNREQALAVFDKLVELDVRCSITATHVPGFVQPDGCWRVEVTESDFQKVLLAQRDRDLTFSQSAIGGSLYVIPEEVAHRARLGV